MTDTPTEDAEPEVHGDCLKYKFASTNSDNFAFFVETRVALDPEQMSLLRELRGLAGHLDRGMRALRDKAPQIEDSVANANKHHIAGFCAVISAICKGIEVKDVALVSDRTDH